MQFPESWLRALCNPAITTDELAHRLTMAGLEVEDVDPVAPQFSGIRVAQVISVEAHPNADKLRVCRVEAGFDQPLQIVCGAPNVAQGIKVPLAKVGAELPGGMKIGVATMRGVESSGMLCSARELGLSEEHSGLLILDDSLEVGQCLRKALDLDDQVLTLKLTPNKADCLSVLGVAREISALTGSPLVTPQLTPVAATLTDRLPVTVEASDLCGRFSGRIIRGVNAKAATPNWMKTRLERAGQRSISALVDISNYVMLELGRPSHVFDLDKIRGGLTVRWAKPGETLTLLNGQTVNLDEQVGVIASESGLESLAGIMGGDATAVSLETQNIYLEAAFWWPEAIAGRARRFNFSTDAGYRFERGVDFATTVEHIEYITRLIVDICGGQVGPVDDMTLALPKREPVSMRVSRCHRILGVQVSAQEIAEIFTRLGLSFTQNDDVFVVTPPSYRFDLEIEEDLIEEVARIYGFERIPEVPPVAPAVMRSQPEKQRSAQAIRQLMVGLEYQELINFSFVEEAWETNYAGNSNPIRLLNPIASQLAVMRSSLIGGLIANAQYNVNRKTNRVRVFEFGRVFMRDATVIDGPLEVAGVQQPLRLAGLAYGSALPEQWGTTTRNVDFYDVKADVETLLSAHDVTFIAEQHPALHPGRSAKIMVGQKQVGWLGELHPKWAQLNDLPLAPIVFELDVAILIDKPLPNVVELSKQPIVQRDLAMWVTDEVTVDAMLNVVKDCQAKHDVCQLIRSVELFDLWKDKNSTTAEKSLAFRFVLQDPQVTLEDSKVDEVMSLVRDAWIQSLGARVR